MDPVEDNNYDILIEGTGLAQSILAAAISRLSKKVIHIDKNTFYGSSFAALSIDQLDDFVATYASRGSTPAIYLFPSVFLDHSRSLLTSLIFFAVRGGCF